jgi:hypothetical protein
MLLPLAIVIAIALAGVGVAGQGLNSVPELVAQVLSAVGVLQTDVDDLQTTLGEVQEAVTGLAPVESNVRVTPAAFFRAGVMDCIQTNVSAVGRRVRIEMIDTATGTAITSNSGAIATPPGRAVSAGVFATAFTGRAYCRFTVLDDGGTRADIRGNLVIGASGANDTTLMSISAE